MELRYFFQGTLSHMYCKPTHVCLYSLILYICQWCETEKRERVQSYTIGFADEGKGNPPFVSKIGRLLVPLASVWAFSNLKLTLEFCWICSNTASSGVVNLHMSKTSCGCKTAPGRFCGCVPPCRCARVLQVELFYVWCAAARRVYPVDGYALSFACS